MSERPTILVCIGAAKAGTTWLFRHLFRHPDCSLRTIKELHYFDMIQDGSQTRARKRMGERIAALRALPEAVTPDGRRRMERQLRDAEDWLRVIDSDHEDVAAYHGYLTKGLCGRSLVADITPAYALLTEPALSRIAAVSEDVRFVYLLRDPVSRLWSQARMVARRNVPGVGELQAAATQAMARLLDRIASGHKDREDFAGTVGRLVSAVAPSRRIVMLMDEMMSDQGLARLQGFLGIRQVPGDFHRPVHPGVPVALDEDLRRRAQAALRPQYDFVARLFPELPASWRRNMGEGLA